MADERDAPEPATERRGGEKPDWAKTKPGKATPEKQEPPEPEPAA